MSYDFQRCRLRWIHNAVLDDYEENVFDVTRAYIFATQINMYKYMHELGYSFNRIKQIAFQNHRIAVNYLWALSFLTNQAHHYIILCTSYLFYVLYCI